MITSNKIAIPKVIDAEQKFWFRWMLNYSFGELLGIGAAATIGRFLFIGFTNTSSSSTSMLAFIIVVIAGTAEGLIIGYVQWRSLSRLILHFKPMLWITITTLSTIAGWLLVLPPAVMFISFLSKLSFFNNYYSLLYSALVGIAFGALIGISQFFILKKFYKNTLVWFFANTLGWALSFIIMYLALSIFTSTTSLVYNFLIIISSCVLSGLVQGIVTGTSLHFLMSIRKEHARKHESNLFLI